MNTDEDVYWEYNDVRADEQNVRFAMIYNQITAAGLGAAMARVRRLLEDIPSLRKWADDYAPSNIDALRSHAWRATGRHLLANSLLFSESTAIRQAREAGYAIARFRDAAAADPEEALAALAEFGSRITQTFHRGLNSLFGSQTLRDLGSLVFLEAARALDPSLAAATPAARLEVIILRESAPSSWASDFMEGKQPDSSVVAVRQPIVGV